MDKPRMLGVVLATLFALAAPGCGGGTAVFQNTSTESYSQVIPQALQVNEAEMAIVIKAGGVVIGTIPGARPGENEDTVADRAGKAAGKHGGTHFVLSAAPLDSFKPSASVPCPPGATGSDGQPCPTTGVEPTTADAGPPPATAKGEDEPAGPARYVIVRIKPEDWHTLPHELRPKRML